MPVSLNSLTRSFAWALPEFIDAVLVDSRLAHKFALTGAMALRARWTSGPGRSFVLAVGGFNPRFAPPGRVPAAGRV